MTTRTTIHPLKIVAAVGAAFLVWGLLLAYGSSPAHADTTFTVNSTGDQNDLDFPDGAFDGSSDANCDVDSAGQGGQCTLRAAIQEANVTAGEDTIEIGVTGTVNLTGVLPNLSSNIRIEGPGSDRLTVRRDTGGGYRIFRVTSGSVVSISGITVSGGRTHGFGGGIGNNGGTLTITDSTISENSASVDGGISNDEGTLTITGSTISGNSANNGGGGGIGTYYGTLTVTDSTISGNSANNNGGGGGIASVTDSVTDLFGHTKTTITNSTVSGNSASGGGGLYNFEGLSVIENSTITKNTAPDGWGSGVVSFGLDDTRTEVLSTIVSANTNTDVDFVGDFVGRTNSFDSKGYNLIGDGNATTRDNAFDQTGDQTGVENPKLGALAENGGPTKTHALLSGSPAIDKGNSALSTDQRGEVRPFDDPGIAPAQGGDDSDIGSFEEQSVLVAPVNDRPTVGVARGDSCGTDYRSGTIRLRVSDVDDPASSLRLLASSSNRTLVPDANISFSGSGHNRTMTLRAADGNSGTALIEITVGDGSLKSTEIVRVKVGTNGANTISGTEDTDVLFGLGSADVLGGVGAEDLLCSGEGVDVLDGAKGDDAIFGGPGRDLLRGGNGDDRLLGGADEDRLYGEDGADRMSGGSGADRFSGGAGQDVASDFSPSQGDTKDTTTEAP